MPRNILFTRVFKTLAANFALLALGVLFMQPASAGCGKYDVATGKPMSDMRSSVPFDGSGFIRTGYYTTVGDDGNSRWDHRFDRAITGLWHFKYLSVGNTSLGIPDGAPVDGGNTIWFADGNEVTSSEMRAPDTGSICMGVWKQTGKSTYELNHIGLSWDPVSNAFVGPAFIKQYVTLQKGGNTYSGTFTITQYGPDGKTVNVVIKGNIVATRVTVNTETQP